MNIYLYILNTLSDWEIGYITAELNSRRYINTDKPFSFIKTGNTLEPITTMGGISMAPDITVDKIKFNKDDILILPGADTWMRDENKRVVEIASELLDKSITVAAICGATGALAAAGFLNNKKHTSNAKEFLAMFCPQYTGANFYIEEPAVTDGSLITATGLAPLEFSYHVFKRAALMKPDTLEAWFLLNKTRESKYFFELMDSVR
jgi:putative intracellular protease/amidase